MDMKLCGGIAIYAVSDMRRMTRICIIGANVIATVLASRQSGAIARSVRPSGRGSARRGRSQFARSMRMSWDEGERGRSRSPRPSPRATPAPSPGA
eukprot:3055935-Pyramimonas_sp.AAC.1